MGRKINRMWNTLGTVLVGLAVLLAAALSGVRLFGLRPYVVLSGSDEKKHVGLCNIRGRLKAMVNGALVMESKPGVSTKAIIMIPKDVTE